MNDKVARYQELARIAPDLNGDERTAGEQEEIEQLEEDLNNLGIKPWDVHPANPQNA